MDAQSRSKPVSCLIINADAAEGKIESGPWAARYSALDHIAEETDDIADYLKSVSAEAGIDEIERIDLSLDPASAQSTLMRVLQRKNWNVVHFAGHGALGTDKTPGIILSARRGIVLPFREFANELKYTQFLFLSACRSSDPAFLNKAIEYSIPEVIGYMWEVDDVEAARFAMSFYQRLFDRTTSTFKCLDHALVAARRSAYDTNPESRIWASPVLLTQPRVNLD
jgi:CHAT domain-containing protein